MGKNHKIEHKQKKKICMLNWQLKEEKKSPNMLNVCLLKRYCLGIKRAAWKCWSLLSTWLWRVVAGAAMLELFCAARLTRWARVKSLWLVRTGRGKYGVRAGVKKCSKNHGVAPHDTKARLKGAPWQLNLGLLECQIEYWQWIITWESKNKKTQWIPTDPKK